VTIASLKTPGRALATPQEINHWLQQGVAAAKAGQIEQARFLLLDVVEQQQTNEVAWYWLYQIFNTVDDKRICLENLIIINPNNLWAKQELLKILDRTLLDTPVAQPETPHPQHLHEKKKPRPLMLKLISAFWAGISFIFLSSGIIAFIQLIAADIGPLPIYALIINLLIAAAFAVVGAMGLTVAISMFMQSMLGFYGSIILALILLLIGPTVSLISNPPNYVTMVCTGGISGMIVLLTLASQSGFEDA
jgi:hypothetical protein